MVQQNSETSLNVMYFYFVLIQHVKIVPIDLPSQPKCVCFPAMPCHARNPANKNLPMNVVRWVSSSKVKGQIQDESKSTLRSKSISPNPFGP